MDGEWARWNEAEHLIRSWVEMWNEDSLCVSLLHLVSCWLDLQCKELEGWYMILVEVNTLTRKGGDVEDNSCLQTKYAGLIKSLICCQRTFRFVCWCRRTLGVISFKSCNQIRGWVKDRAGEAEGKGVLLLNYRWWLLIGPFRGCVSVRSVYVYLVWVCTSCSRDPELIKLLE